METTRHSARPATAASVGARLEREREPLGRTAAAVEAARCLYCDDAPCVNACPTRVDVPEFIRAIATGNPAGAARRILAANPLAGTCGRVCPTEVLCEGACVRAAIDRPVAIGRLQRHAIDAYRASGAPFLDAGPAVGGRVAVVGAGPAGLACAAELRRFGLAVTVFEASREAGGLAATGIVPWRIDRAMLAHEVAEIERVGVRIRRDARVGETLPADRIMADFDAVFLGVGVGAGRRLEIPGEDLPGVFDALEVIERVISGDLHGLDLGRRVAVIGGGDTAIDAAVAARRLGSEEVTVYYRRGENEAPAHPRSVEEARSLGISFHWLAAPVEIMGPQGRLSHVEFDTMRLGPADPSGRASPHPIAGRRFVVAVDSLIRAVGQRGVPELLDGFGVRQREGRAQAELPSGRTSNPKVWAGGDVVSGGGEVVEAVAQGRCAARSIARALGAPNATEPVAGHRGPCITSLTHRWDATLPGVDLAVELAGIRSPNPFWLASSPVTNTGEMVARAFEAGWGGAVWKTVGQPAVNVRPRLGSVALDGRRIVGLSNIELISDRPIEVNLAEIAEVKRRYPANAVVVSLMVESRRDVWQEIVRRVDDTGADGIELNFGCPHGMSERGMGAAVGQVPDYVEMITAWVKEASALPVLVKLTPNVADITPAARAAVRGGADGISLINTVNSLVGVDLASWAPIPAVRGHGTHGGYSGPAVKPIALHMVSACARDPEVGVPISGIGGIDDWRDAVEFLLLGAGTVQVCTAVMHHGYRVVDGLIDGLSTYLQARGLQRPADLVGRGLAALTSWGELDLDYRVVARIDPATCIGCNLCYRACADGGHQAIDLRARDGRTLPEVEADRCVGCRLCEYVCPVDGCIAMEERAPVAAAGSQAAVNR